MEILLRATESTLKEPWLAPDLVWNPANGWADFAFTPGPSGDLQASQGLFTAIIICLFTDARATPAEAAGTSDLRGWWGDTIDLEPGEAPLGSKLWLLMRSTLTAKTAGLAETYARSALAPLIASGAVGRFVVTAETDFPTQRLGLSVLAYAPDGSQIFGQRFQVLWNQIYPA